MTRLLSSALAAVMMLGLPIAAATPALAHAALLSEVPAANATLSAPLPTELTLSFSEGLELSFTKVAVKGPDGTALALGTLSLGSDGKTLTVPLAAPLPKGTITIEWTAVATDGHKTKGSYTLDIAN